MPILSSPVAGRVATLASSMMERCVSVQRFSNGGCDKNPEEINVIRLNSHYRFYHVWVEPKDLAPYIDDPNCLVFSLDLSQLVYWFRFFSLKDLRLLCRSHGINPGQQTKAALGKVMKEHACIKRCESLVYIFKCLPRPRQHVSVVFEEDDPRFQFSNVPPDPRDVATVLVESLPPVDANPTQVIENDIETDALEGYDHLIPISRETKEAIIREWQDEMGTDSLTVVVCAACAIRVPRKNSLYTYAGGVNLTLLQNLQLPVAVLPTSYDLTVYQSAILHPGGLEFTDRIGRMRLCTRCNNALLASRVPKFALCNWLYYGHNSLPDNVREALASASVFEKMLICRARANSVTCRFNTSNAPESGNPVLNRARKGIRGNVLVAPLDVVRMNEVIPPSSESIRDTMCAVFIGNTIPTKATINRCSPALVRKSRVKTLIRFLLDNNEHYKPSDSFQYSEDNLNSLFESTSEDKIPSAVHIGYMRGNDAIDSTVADYTTRNHDETSINEVCDELLMENVGYTEGDNTPLAYLSMKALALERCLQGKPFVASGTGSLPVREFHNPSILTWLFPHLDPWGIGGFHHPGRLCKMSMLEQLRHLLAIEDSPFERDPEFAFVFYNVCRKLMVARSLRFTVSRSAHRNISRDLLSIDPDLLLRLNERCQKNPHYKPVEEKEKRAFKLLSMIRTVSKHIPGSDGYKIMMRNEIRALINYKGTPTLFVTINPSDVDHPLVRLLAGQDIQLDDICRGEDLSKWKRSLFAAKNPSACAIFFHVMITQYIRTILRHGWKGDGLYGRSVAYYGTVEAQGKGTLHCHMLVWLAGHLSPHDLKVEMLASETYRDRVLAWMDSVISRQFPNSRGVVQQKEDHPRRILHKDTGDPHPGVIPAPSIVSSRSSEEFWNEFDRFLERLIHQYAWHEHQATCWKYLGRGQEKNDQHCRMGMDGVTHELSSFDNASSEITLRRHHPKIAPHTDVVSFLMQCNTDVKYVGSGEAAKSYLYYVTDYITKASLPVHVGMSALSYAVTKIYSRVPDGLNGISDNEARGAVITAVNSMMGRQEISQPQVMSYLVGGGDHYTSHQFVLLQWSAFKKHWAASCGLRSCDPSATDTDQGGAIERGTVDMEQSVSLTLGHMEITASSQLLDYIYRPTDPKFSELCLYDFVGLTSKSRFRSDNQEKRSVVEVAGSFANKSHPQYLTHYLTLRRDWKIPVLLGSAVPNPSRSEAMKEDWAREILILFKPWTDIGSMRSVDTTWLETFSAYEARLSHFHRKIIKNMQALTECGEARDRHRQSRIRASAPIHIATEREFDPDVELLGEQGEIDGDLDDDYDEDPFLELDEVGGMGSEGRNRDVLSEASSRLLDMCLPVKMEDLMRGQDQSNSAVTPSVVVDDDLPILAQHMALMQLKRKRKLINKDTDKTESPETVPRQDRDGEPISERVVLRAGSVLQKLKTRHLAIAENIIGEMGLRNNPRQLKAFNIIAEQVIEKKDSQLLMHVAGVGGTGKSHVIKAVVTLFERLNRGSELLLGAPTGIAAVLIKGQTLHSLIKLNPNNKRSNVSQLIEIWKFVKFLIVDEVSMIGARFLSQLSDRIRQGKGDDLTGREKPFGGVNVIFMGDFGQLKPPKQHSLYANELIKNPSFAESRNGDGIHALNGAFLWRQVKTVVELVQNQRHSDDPPYAEFLSRLRLGECTTNGSTGAVSDLEYLSTRLLEKQASCLNTIEKFRYAPIIVGSKSLRDLLNVKLIKYHAKRMGVVPALYCSRDFVDRKATAGAIRRRMWCLPSSVNCEAFGRLPLFIGMKVMVTENLAFGNGIVNGSEGIVQNIKYEEDDSGIRYAKVVYVHIPGCGLKVDGLGDDTVPIFSVTSQITHGVVSSHIKSRTFSRRQIPLVPAYAYTDFKSQGRTLTRVIVDLATARGQGVYVMLSRVKSLSGLLILRWFPPSKIYHRLSEELRAELERIRALASETPDVLLSDTDAMPVEERALISL